MSGRRDRQVEKWTLRAARCSPLPTILFYAKQTGTRIAIMKNGVLVAEAATDTLSHTELAALYLEQMRN
jgi:hypothetical protein